ncbi:MAG: hypothetical protein V4700_00725 [Pseudomonadota bacterium]
MSQSLPTDLIKATTGDYSIPLFAIFASAWHCIKGIKKAFWLGFCLLFLIMVGLYVLLGFILAVCDIFHFYHLRAVCQFFAGGFVDVFRLLLSISLVFLALHHVRKEKVNATMVFEFCKDWKPLAFIGVILYLLNQGLLLVSRANFISEYKLLGNEIKGVLIMGKSVELILFILLYSYITLLITMAMLLILDKKMQLKDSVKIALISINQHWFKNIVLFILASLLFLLVGVVTLGIGLIWVLPLLFLITAIQYEHIFCEGKIAVRSIKI